MRSVLPLEDGHRERNSAMVSWDCCIALEGMGGAEQHGGPPS
jgi:hypothetical protein